MDPVCDLCGAKHHPRQAHRFNITVVNQDNEVVANYLLKPINLRSLDRHKKTPERLAYMRDYMRKRRALKLS